MQATPTTWQLLVDAGWTGSDSLKLACGGEALTRALADQLLDRCGSLWQMYGPTETTIWSSVLRLDRSDEAPRLGGPILNTRFYVLDDHRRPVPVGVPGELYIGGDGVAEGYHNRPELTAERFVPDPFQPDGGRIYRTGDMVRWREDGTLDFLGRIDQQVKLRGFRIELEEIEAALAAQDAVNVAVATVREDVPGDKRLVAYIVLREGDTPDIDALRSALKARLPPYMVPSAFVPLSSMPTTPNGKLDRKALPAPDGATRELGSQYAPPTTPVEEALATIWSQVLRVERVGIDDDFFDLGGHSLLAVKMVAQVDDDLGVELPLRRLFEAPRIRELAATITEQMLGDADDDELASLLAEVEGS
jgi:acyl-CoA synthetase (AMP-forming)/AMP-acid ligase II/acyl carrier protein